MLSGSEVELVALSLSMIFKLDILRLYYTNNERLWILKAIPSKSIGMKYWTFSIYYDQFSSAKYRQEHHGSFSEWKEFFDSL
ncbi:MAG: hypothetical protein ACRD8W_16925, partial [Nitrososphaeraceae archaeon]